MYRQNVLRSALGRLDGPCGRLPCRVAAVDHRRSTGANLDLPGSRRRDRLRPRWDPVDRYAHGERPCTLRQYSYCACYVSGVRVGGPKSHPLFPCGVKPNLTFFLSSSMDFPKTPCFLQSFLLPSPAQAGLMSSRSLIRERNGKSTIYQRQ